MFNKINSYAEVVIKNIENISIRDTDQAPIRILITGNDGRDYAFVYESNEEKYFYLRGQDIRREVYFTFFETDNAVKISDIDLKFISNLGLGSRILAFAENYSKSKQKDLMVMLCSNYWLINHLRKRYPRALISIYDFNSETQVEAMMSELDVLKVFGTFLLKVEEPYPTEIYFRYDQQQDDYISEQGDKFQLSFEQQSKPKLLFQYEGNAMTIADFQIYCWNQIATITVPLSGPRPKR